MIKHIRYYVYVLLFFNTYVLVKIHDYIMWIGHDFDTIINQHQYSLLIKSKNDFKLYKTKILMKIYHLKKNEHV